MVRKDWKTSFEKKEITSWDFFFFFFWFCVGEDVNICYCMIFRHMNKNYDSFTSNLKSKLYHINPC